ncbi:MAG: hypothetical protein IJV42_06855 [Bacteroidaceae bacterium]|nr:hypothetical protein [Bacteroidaceae bacterium]
MKKWDFFEQRGQNDSCIKRLGEANCQLRIRLRFQRPISRIWIAIRCMNYAAINNEL